MKSRPLSPLPTRPALHRLLLASAAVTLAALCAAPALAADPKASRFYEDALTRYQKNDLPGAIIQLKNALQIDKGLLPVHVLLGKALQANGDMVAAEAALTEALRLGVNRAEVALPLALAVQGQGRPQDVLDETRFPSTGLPAFTQAELLLVKAGAQADLGRPREALQFIESARALQPESAASWMAELPIRIRARQMAQARDAGDRAMALNPASAQALYLRGSVSHAANDTDTALVFYERALKLAPTHLESLLARAGIRIDRGQQDEAGRDLATARESYPRDPRATYLRALLAERQGQTSEARQALAEVTGLLDPIPMVTLRYRPQLLMLGGLSHYGLGQLEKAKPYLETIQRDQPGSPAAKLLGQIHVTDKSFDRAIEVLEAYLRGQPRDGQAQVLLANAHLIQGRNARAVQVLSTALKSTDTPAIRSALGLALVRSDKAAEALPHLEQAYRQDPTQLGTGVLLAQLYLRARQPQRALTLAEALVKRDPRRAELHNLLGEVRAQLADRPRARAAFEQALKIDPALDAATLGLARLDSRDGKLEAAATRLDQLLARDTRQVEALVERGLLAERLGRDAEATSFFVRAFDHSATADLKPGLMLVTHHLRADRVAAAIETVKQLTLKAPDKLSVHMANARVSLASEDLVSARTYLIRATRAAEFDPELQVQVALMQLQVRDAKGAQYSLSKALQAAPGHLAAQALMVEAEVALGELPEAEQRARSLVGKHPRLPAVQALLGDVALARGQTALSVQAYRRALELQPSSTALLRLHRVLNLNDPAAARQLGQQWLKKKPDDMAVHSALADGHARSGELGQARAAYEQVLRLQPDNAEALNNYAQVLLGLKDPGALRAAERALALRPETPHVLGTAGWVAFHAGQTDRALQLLSDARLRDPSNGETRFYLASVLASAGRQTEARQELESALRSGRPFVSAAAAQTLLTSLR